MTSLSHSYSRAETNADNIRDVIKELDSLFEGKTYFDMAVINNKAYSIRTLNVEEELDVMVRMEETAKAFQRLLRLEQRRRAYHSEIGEKERQTNTRENIQSMRKETRRARACPYTRQSSSSSIQ